MTGLKTALIFLVAVAGELSGAYAIWRWRREGGSAWLIVVGAGALLLYAFVQTFQPETSFGRLFAAYAGVFLIGAIVWGVLFEGFRPDRYDLIGASLVLAGITVILGGRHLP